ncbi:MAG TPA: hypothetical protein VFL57_21060 [Bryobacteraceae bacterium]|nr:hypothetical protein [Bryobacteraceae bacterium]
MTTIRIAIAVFWTCAAAAQVCRVSTSGLNQNRRVMGPIHTECPPNIHTPPFGNWGVSSNFGPKYDGHQFQGWCHNSRICDNDGNCRTDCRDGWYEWNSCTDVRLYQPPNCTLYNAENCTQQATVTGINVHGRRVVDVPVRCPADSDGDGVSDRGGCGDVLTFSNGTNFMSLYELDPVTGDDLVQTLYFPESPLTMNCDVWGCPAVVSGWMQPGFYQSPSAPAKVYAEMAMRVDAATFADTSRACRAVGPVVTTVNGASFRGPIAPDSIASAFGNGLSTTTAAAAGTLSTMLGDMQVTVTDSAGSARRAALFYVSPNQVNFQTPPATVTGTAQITISRTDTVVSRGTVLVSAVAPGLFAANANGQGVASATAVAIDAAGTQQPIPVFACNATCEPVPMDVSTRTVVLSLYGTGIRLHPGLDTIQVSIGGLRGSVLYAGPQGQYVGLDQVNVIVPRELAGRGVVNVDLSVAGVAANRVTIAVQ